MSSQNPGGSSTADKVIDFQQQVGSVGASFGVIGAYIIAILLGLLGIAGAMAVFVPMSPIDCPDRVSDAQKEVKEACQASPSPGKASPVCQSKKNALADAKKYCSQKTKHYGFILFLLLIPLGFGIVWLAKLQKKYVDTNPAYGAVAGTATEIGMAADLFRSFKG